MTAYVVDSSSLIRAWVEAYPIDLFPTLWDQIKGMVADRRLFIPEEVVKEVRIKDDGLRDWIAVNGQNGVVPSDSAIFQEVQAIVNKYSGMVTPGVNRGQADPFVVATARLWKAVVVSEEKDDGSMFQRNKLLLSLSSRMPPTLRSRIDTSCPNSF
ncbi:MAG: DUF4411 family protein [Acidimicrobiia bacterium]|nr:DUF4411 family protein [Acidimicrobiia bacterium]MYC58199.1 DUF4411 family protein [Acidimicrobiia bacterium]MYI30631.1 DUF4411 family protein [Acidimicrobiia bacterium]